jgi:hypothetical protein
VATRPSGIVVWGQDKMLGSEVSKPFYKYWYIIFNFLSQKDTLPFHYKDQQVNDLHGKIRRLLWETCGIQQQTVWENEDFCCYTSYHSVYIIQVVARAIYK